MQLNQKAQKIVLIAASIIAFLGIIWLIYFLWPGKDNGRKTAFDYMPEQTALIFRINNGGVFSDSLLNNKTAPLPIDMLPVISTWKQLYNQSDASFSRTKNPTHEWIRNGCWYIALVCEKTENNVLFIRELATEDNAQVVIDNITKNAYKSSQTETEDGAIIYDLQDSMGVKFSFTIDQNVLIASFNQASVKNSLLLSQSGKGIKKTAAFEQVIKTSSSNSLFNVIVHFDPMYKMLCPYLNPNQAEDLAFLSALSEWGEMDINPIAAGISFSGFFSCAESTNSVLSHFTDHNQTHPLDAEIIPDNILYNVGFAFENYTDFIAGYLQWSGITSSDSVVALKELLGNGFSLMACPDNKGGIDQYAIFRLNNSSEANDRALVSLMNSFSMDESDNKEVFRGTSIHRFNFPQISLSLGGALFNPVTSDCWVYYKEHIIFAKGIESMKGLLNRIISGRTLSQSPHYQMLSGYMAAQSNISLLLSPAANPATMLNLWLQDSVAALWQKTAIGSAIQSIGLSLTMDGSRCLISGAIVFGNVNVEMTSGWQTRVDQTVSGGPWILQYGKDIYVLVQDTYNNLYLLSYDGQLLWKSGIEEQIIGNALAVYKNEDPYIAFATSHKIILLNLKGETLKPFPIEINEGLGSGLMAADYDNNKQYRLLALARNGQLLNFQTDGKATTGWKIPQTSIFKNAVCTHVKLKGTDYIVICSSEGSLCLISRTGKLAFSLKNIHCLNDESQIFADSKSGYLYASDQGGSIIRISVDGKKEIVVPGSFSSSHAFGYADADADGEKDFIIIDEGSLHIIKKDGKIILKQSISETAVAKIQVISAEEGDYLMIQSQDGAIAVIKGTKTMEEFPGTKCPNGASIIMINNILHFFGVEGDVVIQSVLK